MSEELKSNENVGAPQPDALAQIASVDPSPAVGGMHPFTPAMLSRLKKQRQLLSELEHALKNHEFCFFLQPKCNSMTRAIVGIFEKCNSHFFLEEAAEISCLETGDFCNLDRKSVV